MSEITIEKTERDTPRASSAATFRLVVTSEGDKSRELWVHDTSPGPMRIGSSRACDLVLSDRKVSRRHVDVECKDGRLSVTDLRSTNGLTVNGVSVETAFLRGGEVIRVGDVLLAVEAHVPSATTSLPAVQSFGRMIGSSVAMRRLYPLLDRLAASDLTVIIEGETGTGKELLAETLHEMSRRRSGPFVVVDAHTFDEDALERVLFGGATPGSSETLAGSSAFEDAHTGTLFIDDIADLPLALQTRLLRVIDRGEIVQPGGAASKVDVRLFVGTRQDLNRAVEDGNFREDLFHRLAVGRVELPPLRARDEDIPLLVDHFWRELDRTGAPPPSDIPIREGHRWPGNVRELKNLVTQRFVAGSPLPEVEGHLASSAQEAAPAAVLESIVAKDLPFVEARERAVAAFERLYITRTLDRHHGNVTQAAAVSGLARRYFHRLKARHLK